MVCAVPQRSHHTVGLLSKSQAAGAELTLNSCPAKIPPMLVVGSELNQLARQKRRNAPPQKVGNRVPS